MDFLASTTTIVPEKALNGLNLRSQALASNLANVDTPGYRRQDVKFEGALQQALNAGSGNENSLLLKRLPPPAPNMQYLPLEGQTQGVEAVTPAWTQDHAGFEYRNDGNNVDVEVEMVRVAQNTQRFVSMAMLEGKQLKGLKAIINNNING